MERAKRPAGRFPLLREGSLGRWVSFLQERLASAGFYDGDVDGVFGETTLDAVRSFQRAFRLPPDGVAGPQVLALLSDPLLAVETRWGGDGRPRVPVLAGGTISDEDPVPDLALRFDSGYFARGPAPIGRPLRTLRRLVVAWGEPDGSDAPSELPPGVSALAHPYLVVRVDRWRRPAVETPPPRCSPLTVPAVILDLPGVGLGVRLRAVARAIARSLPRAPEAERRVILVGRSPEGLPAGPTSGPLPLATSAAVGRALSRLGWRPWLSVPLRTIASSPGLLRWEGFQTGRLGRWFERIVVWAPLPDAELAPAIESVRWFVKGMRRMHPHWRLLLGLDLAPWRIDPASPDGAPGARLSRLTHTDAILLAWQLRMARLARRDEGEEMPRLARWSASSVWQWLWMARWAGLGGLVLAGLDQADAATRQALSSTLVAVKLARGPA